MLVCYSVAGVDSACCPHNHINHQHARNHHEGNVVPVACKMRVDGVLTYCKINNKFASDK